MISKTTFEIMGFPILKLTYPIFTSLYPMLRPMKKQQIQEGYHEQKISF